MWKGAACSKHSLVSRIIHFLIKCSCKQHRWHLKDIFYLVDLGWGPAFNCNICTTLKFWWEGCFCLVSGVYCLKLLDLECVSGNALFVPSFFIWAIETAKLCLCKLWTVQVKTSLKIHLYHYIVLNLNNIEFLLIPSRMGSKIYNINRFTCNLYHHNLD